MNDKRNPRHPCGPVTDIKHFCVVEQSQQGLESSYSSMTQEDLDETQQGGRNKRNSFGSWLNKRTDELAGQTCR
ncbi:hypothetical protein UPYG_G00008930 [Umbra pygmaea]|uniref:Uncharacterized protein n=1 Tax=Umbra pygmaea TaxID=75934 RepID=A0ABD0XI44_UMBPY